MTVLTGLIYRSLLLLLVGEEMVVEVLILEMGVVQDGAVSSAPLVSHWGASPEMHWGVARLCKEPPLV